MLVWKRKRVRARLQEYSEKLDFVRYDAASSHYIVFAYAPMYGVQLAFKNYKIKLGIMGSPWVGLDHFKRFFNSYNFSLLLKNTLGISIYSLLVGFPIPIIFALLLNYIKNRYLKKTVQMVSYAPYFISTVVICGMLTIFMNPDTGVFNTILKALGMEPLDFLSKPKWFKSIYVWSGVCRNAAYYLYFRPLRRRL